jgi:hypothetical protein
LELAAQPFIVTDSNRVGSAKLIVRASAAGKAPPAGPVPACGNKCVVVATIGAGYSYVVAPISFSQL